MKGHIAIAGVLLSDSNVTAIVGQRIYPLRRPQKSALPAIVYELSGVDPHDTKSGPSTMDHDYVRVFIESNDYNTNYVNLISAVRTALDRYNGTINSITVQSVQFEGVTEFDENIDNNTVYVSEMEFKVSCNV